MHANRTKSGGEIWCANGHRWAQAPAAHAAATAAIAIDAPAPFVDADAFLPWPCLYILYTVDEHTEVCRRLRLEANLVQPKKEMREGQVIRRVGSQACKISMRVINIQNTGRCSSPWHISTKYLFAARWAPVQLTVEFVVVFVDPRCFPYPATVECSIDSMLIPIYYKQNATLYYTSFIIIIVEQELIGGWKCPSLWPSGIGSRLGRNRLWFQSLAVSNTYSLFI